jgi:hypothetical protein
LPSNALSVHLDQLLGDATELDTIHSQLRTGLAGRQYGLASLNRAAVVISVSAWESYVEELMRESLQALRPAAPPLGNWPSQSAFILGELGRFHTPNAQNVANLINRCLGLSCRFIIDFSGSHACIARCIARGCGVSARSSKGNLYDGIRTVPVRMHLFASEREELGRSCRSLKF